MRSSATGSAGVAAVVVGVSGRLTGLASATNAALSPGCTRSAGTALPSSTCRRVVMVSTRASSSASCCAWPMRRSRSEPCSRTSMWSGSRRSRPSWAATSKSSMAWAICTPWSRPTMRAAPLSECAARMQASSWLALVGSRSRISRPVSSTCFCASASSRNRSSSDASLIWSGVT